MKIGIRTDGGFKIGMGHVMRTLSLAKELRREHEVYYICLKDKNGELKAGIDKIKDNDFNIYFISQDNMIKELSQINLDCLITDSYDVDEEYFKLTRKYFKCTGYIDDNCLINFDVDFIINQNLTAEDFKYKVPQQTRLLLGSKYVMLRDEFRNLPHRCIEEEVSNILITVGGSDNDNITYKLLSKLYSDKFKYYVVIGPAFSHDIILKLKDINKNNVELCYNANMYELMNKCDVAVSSCGSTLYELAACGVPTIGFIAAENQVNLYTKAQKLGLIKGIGWYSNINERSFEVFQNILENYSMRSDMSILGQNVIDGRGIDRIIKCINSII